MPVGQGWLNKWVSVNSRHVVFPPSKDEEKQKKKQQQGDSGDGSVKTAGTLPTTQQQPYVETQAIRRFNNRKHRRRGLTRTTSASDLIRQIEKGGDIIKEETAEEALDRSSRTQQSANNQQPGGGAAAVSVASAGGNSASPAVTTHFSKHEDPSITSHHEEGSLRFVSGFFGIEEDTTSLLKDDSESIRRQSSSVHSVGSAPNRRRTASLHNRTSTMPPLRSSDNTSLHAASVHLMGPRGHLEAASVTSRDGQSLPPLHRSSANGAIVKRADSLKRVDSLKRADSQDSTKGKGLGILFPQSLFGDHNGKSCKQCTKTQSEMATMREDLEYLRDLAIRNEYVCSNCQTESPPQTDDDDSLPVKSSKADDESDLFNEVVRKHKAHLDKLESARQTMQNNTQAQLQQFGKLCRDLDEEAAIRNAEAIELHRELDTVRQDRDKISAELEQANALILQYELNHSQNEKNVATIHRLESDGLDGVSTAITTRDKIIVDLASRLEHALACVEFEREQQRQRRKIIFPAQKTSQGEADGADLGTEVASVKSSLREAQATIESLEHEMGKKEREWMIKFENLERQLEAARAGSIV